MSKDLNKTTGNVNNAKVINLHMFRHQNELYVLNDVLKNIGRILVPYVTNINYILMSFFNKGPEINVSAGDIGNIKQIGTSLTKIFDSLNGIVLTVNNAAEQINGDEYIRSEELSDKFSVVHEITKSLEEIAMQTNILALNKVFTTSDVENEDLALAISELQELAAESIKVSRYASDLIKKDASENEE